MIDVFASEPQFLDHMAPIARAMDAQVFVHRTIAMHAVRRGLRARTDFGPSERPVLVASYGDHKRARRAGRRHIAYIEHGIGQSYNGDPRSAGSPSYSGGADRRDVGLFLVPNEDAARRWRTSYPGANVAVVGCPKLGELERAPATDAPVVILSWHFDCRLAPESRTARAEYQAAVPELVERFDVVGHGHPKAFWHDRLEHWHRKAGITRVEQDLTDALRIASVYVCDNSSSMFEAAALGIPVVVVNASFYRRDVNHGLRFWEAADVGIQVDRSAGLVPAVERALTDPPAVRAARERALGIVYAHRGADATERAVAALEGWMRTLGARAA